MIWIMEFVKMYTKNYCCTVLGNTSIKKECFLSGIAQITSPPPLPSFRATCISFSAVKIVKFCQNCKILSKLWNSVNFLKFCKKFEILLKLWCLNIVCGIVRSSWYAALCLAKTTRVGMLWYELNIVN